MIDRNVPDVRSRKGLRRRLVDVISAGLAPWKLRRNWEPRPVSDLQSQSGLPLVISLTSYPRRFLTLERTIKSLLVQTVEKKRVILWIAYPDVTLIPSSVVRLKQDGLEIREIDDYCSHKKYLGAFRDFPDHAILLCDDDTDYWPSWAEELLAASHTFPDSICCHRAHQILLDADGLPQPYHQWLQKLDKTAQGPLIFATGMGGVLYPPHSLHPKALDSRTAIRLCPTGDDIWLYWMARLAGREFRQIGPRRQFAQWAGSQRNALWRINNGRESGNDKQISGMIKAFGVDVFKEAGRLEASHTTISTAP